MVDRILSGDPTAFKKLVKEHERLVGQMIFRMVPNETDREDVCQDVFVKVYQNLEAFRFDCKLSTWIARIAYTTCLNYLEKKRLPLYDDTHPEGIGVDDCMSQLGDPEHWAGSRQAAVRVCEEIDKLPVIYGTILSLFHLHEMSYAEIGRILRLPDGTVKSYLFRARKLLKERLQVRYSLEELCA
ncbi:MAG: sigma-70 family RNA polymerase sigma factor [Candidatus Zixiibacteriota bacterium]